MEMFTICLLPNVYHFTKIDMGVIKNFESQWTYFGEISMC